MTPRSGPNPNRRRNLGAMESDLSTIEPGTGQTEPSSTRGRARRIVGRVVLVLLTAGALVHPSATLLSRSSWQAELFSHFQLPGLAVTLTALAAAAWRHRWLAFVLVILAAV